jgi:GDP-L-fucose synthase
MTKGERILEWDSTILVAGGQTPLGSALVRRLRQQGFCGVLGDGPQTPDLARREAVHEYFAHHRPRFVFHAAGRSGGIAANQSQPAVLCHDNLTVTLNLLEAAHRFGVRRLLYGASACCYPRLAPQPLRVESLWSGPLESTNEAYAAAKLAGIALCRAYRQQHGCDFVVGIATNSFGPGGDFDPRQAHVIGALMARMHEARMAGEPSVNVWGTGKPVREFLYVDDLADACLHVMRHAPGVELINLAGGVSLSVAELAERIRRVVGYRGRLVFDASRPDGMPLKSLDGEPLATLGWRPKTDFDDGLGATYEWFLQNTSRLAHAG